VDRRTAPAICHLCRDTDVTHALTHTRSSGTHFGCPHPAVPCSGFAPLRLRCQPSTPTTLVPGTSSPGSRDLRLRHAHLRPRRIHSARPGKSEQVAKQVASAQSLSGGCLRQPPLAVRPRSESSACRARVSRSMDPTSARRDSLAARLAKASKLRSRLRALKSRVPLDEVQGTTRVSRRQPKWVPPLPVVWSREALVFTAFGATWAKPLLEVVAPTLAVLIRRFRAQASLRSAFDVSLRLRRFRFRGLRPRAAVTCDSDTRISGRGGFTPPGLARASKLRSRLRALKA
jgi:hypothetical protein